MTITASGWTQLICGEGTALEYRADTGSEFRAAVSAIAAVRVDAGASGSVKIANPLPVPGTGSNTRAVSILSGFPSSSFHPAKESSCSNCPPAAKPSISPKCTFAVHERKSTRWPAYLLMASINCLLLLNNHALGSICSNCVSRAIIFDCCAYIVSCCFDTTSSSNENNTSVKNTPRHTPTVSDIAMTQSLHVLNSDLARMAPATSVLR